MEPIVFTGDTKEMPRFFPTMAGAKAALGQWLLGKVTCYRGGGYDSSGESWYEEENELVPQPNRIRENMEIVPIQITLPDPQDVV
jgi:hypothetical protein